MDHPPPHSEQRVWIAACSHRLHRQWQNISPATLESVAAEIRADAELRHLDPVDAAVAWLRRGLPHLED